MKNDSLQSRKLGKRRREVAEVGVLLPSLKRGIGGMDCRELLLKEGRRRDGGQGSEEILQKGALQAGAVKNKGRSSSPSPKLT